MEVEIQESLIVPMPAFRVSNIMFLFCWVLFWAHSTTKNGDIFKMQMLGERFVFTME